MHGKKILAGLIALSAISAVEANDNDIKWSGYLNLTGGILKDAPVSDRSTDEQHPGYKAYENRFTGDQDTLFALQASKSLGKNLSLTGQMVARGGAEQFKSTITWAYVTFDIDEHSSLRAGRLRAPYYFFSDFIDVGTAYNWVTPPFEVYDVNTSYQGFNYLRHDSLVGVELDTEIFAGSGNDELTRPDGLNVNTNTRDEYGISFTGNTMDWLTARAFYTSGFSSVETDYDLSVIEAIDPAAAEVLSGVVNYDMSKYEYSAFALKADFEKYFLMAESIHVNTYSTMNVFQRRWYTTAGMRSGNLTFHLTYGRAEDDLDSLDQGYDGITKRAIKTIEEMAAKNSESYTVGVRIDTTRTTALKFDLMQFQDFASTPDEKSGIGKNTLLRAAFSASF